MRLTDKQVKFCREYCIDLNATQAAIRAGYNAKSARSIGSENLAKPDIQRRISELQSDLVAATGLTPIRVLEEHKKMAFSSIANLHNSWIELTGFQKLSPEQKACIKSIQTKVIKRNDGTNKEPIIVDVEFVKVELFDKQRSLDAISRMLGFDAPQSIEASLNVDALTDIQIDKIIEILEFKLNDD